MFCTQKHLSNVTHKRTSSGDKGFYHIWQIQIDFTAKKAFLN